MTERIIGPPRYPEHDPELADRIRSLTRALYRANQLVSHPELPKSTSDDILRENEARMKELKDLAGFYPELVQRLAAEEIARIKSLAKTDEP